MAGMVAGAASIDDVGAGLNLDAFSDGQAYYGGQKIYDVFKKASREVNPDFTWGGP